MAQQRPISNRPALMDILRGFLFRKGKGLVKVQGGYTEGLQRRLHEGLPFFSGIERIISMSLASVGGFFTTGATWKALCI